MLSQAILSCIIKSMGDATFLQSVPLLSRGCPSKLHVLMHTCRYWRLCLSCYLVTAVIKYFLISEMLKCGVKTHLRMDDIGH